VGLLPWRHGAGPTAAWRRRSTMAARGRRALRHLGRKGKRKRGERNVVGAEKAGPTASPFPPPPLVWVALLLLLLLLLRHRHSLFRFLPLVPPTPTPLPFSVPAVLHRFPLAALPVRRSAETSERRRRIGGCLGCRSGARRRPPPRGWGRRGPTGKRSHAMSFRATPSGYLAAIGGPSGGPPPLRTTPCRRGFPNLRTR